MKLLKHFRLGSDITNHINLKLFDFELSESDQIKIFSSHPDAERIWAEITIPKPQSLKCQELPSFADRSGIHLCLSHTHTFGVGTCGRSRTLPSFHCSLYLLIVHKHGQPNPNSKTKENHISSLQKESNFFEYDEGKEEGNCKSCVD